MARKRIDKTDAILKAASKIFAEYGFSGAKISEIAREAGVADGTIYLYFQNKEDILLTLFRTSLEDFVSQLKEKLENAGAPSDALRIICDFWFSYMEENVYLAQLNLVELRQHTSGERRKELNEYITPFFELIEWVIKQGMEDGSFRPGLEVRHTRRLIFGAMDQIISSWLVSGRKYSLTALIPSTCEFIIKGLQ
jgi:TetR/AcrR family fatty acid metabolism transcriptional regulator